MKISVIGCGYLGAVHAASMASLGHSVVGVDTDARKIADLSLGKAPFHEPGFDQVLADGLEQGKLSFTTDISAVEGSDIHFIGVGTPQKTDGYGADLTHIDAAFGALADHLVLTADGRIPVIAGKSTVPVGTAERLAEMIGDKAVVVWNPEFLREGFAVQDTLRPDRIVYGLPAGADEALRAREALNEAYALILEEEIPLLEVDYATAELVKVAANSFLATKISFINAMAEMCEATGADVKKLAEAIGYDERIGRKFLRAGIGFGGGCLPKDIRAFMSRAGELGAEQSLTFLREVDSINLRRRQHVVDLAQQLLGGNVSGKKVTVLGAAFKPNSDDIRDSPAVDIGSRLAGLGAAVTFTDPAASSRLRSARPDLNVISDTDRALAGAELVLLLTEWDEYVALEPMTVGELVSKKKIIDGRNALDLKSWRSAGWSVTALGRP